MKVLIADDDSIVRRSLARALSRQSFHVVEACDGEEALKFWKESNFNAVILDVLMPKLNGIEVFENRPRSSQAKVVFISAFSGDEVSEETVGQMGDLFIKKPFENIFNVIEQIEKIL